MIYLIGGPSRSGKTMLASMVAEKVGARILPMDFVEAAITEFYPTEKEKAMRPFSHMRNETNRDNAVLVQKYSAEQIVAAYVDQGRSTWESIKAMVNYGISLRDNIVIEGYQITPNFLNELLNEENSMSVRAVFLLKEDERSIVAGWEEGAPNNDWLLKDSNKETQKKYAHITALHGKATREDSEKFGFDYFNMDTDFSSQLVNALACICKL
ncbi:MAG: hypothetical protein QF741_00505 [Candidatus Peribacteraceae bacterium]|jgi:hypothetical protein|nr:hypothetical protein [Candidatus Peribacteraceae bacterium]MDP7454219.1 hypothetical protein [Candidatus Peribacteraceae bacterium]